MTPRDNLRAVLLLILGVAVGMTVQRAFDRTDDAPAPVAEAAPAIAAPRTDATPPAEPADDDAATTPAADFDAEAVMYDQPRLMQQAIARLTSQTPGKTDLYVIAFGGDGAEDVFRNEAEYVEHLFARRYDAAGHTLTLVNNPATLATRPLASLTNLETALDAVAQRMDPAEDVLLLFLTSHGSEDHELLVDLDPLPLNQIGAEDLARALNARPFRWKVVVVSACYSGGFVAPLKNATSLIIAAAREDRTSFGCGSDSDMTYFGRAYFAEGLNQTDSFTGAFGIATNLINDWEDRDNEVHSEPQIASTPLIEAKLKSWRDGIRLGPPVPFVPPAEQLTAKR